MCTVKLGMCVLELKLRPGALRWVEGSCIQVCKKVTRIESICKDLGRKVVRTGGRVVWVEMDGLGQQQPQTSLGDS
jgi:hypothetical protein